MTTSAHNLIAHLAGHRLSVDEMSWSRASFDWSLRADPSAMKRCLSNLDSAALTELIWAAEFLAGMAQGTIKQRHPDALPEGVDGHRIVGARA